MKHLKPFTFNQTTFDPVVLTDGTLLLVHRTRDGIHVVDANNLYPYAISCRGEDAAYVLPLDTDIDAWIAGSFPEKGVIHTGVIFGRDASHSFEDDIDAWHEDGDSCRLSYKKAEKVANEAGGCFVHRTWETEGERDAYRQGMSDVFDWIGYTDLEEMYGAALDENGITFPEMSE